MEYRLNKHTYKIHVLSRILIFIIISAILIIGRIILVQQLNNDILNNVTLIIVILIVLLLAIYTFINPYLLYKHARIYLNEGYIEYHTGLMFHKTSFIPIQKIQQVEISIGIIQKRYNASSITINTSFDSLNTHSIDSELAQELKSIILNKITINNHED